MRQYSRRRLDHPGHQRHQLRPDLSQRLDHLCRPLCARHVQRHRCARADRRRPLQLCADRHAGRERQRPPNSTPATSSSASTRSSARPISSCPISRSMAAIRKRTAPRRRSSSIARIPRGPACSQARSSPIRRCSRSSHIRSRRACAASSAADRRPARLEGRLFPHREHQRHHPVLEPVLGSGFFTNVPETLRQGVEACLTYTQGPLQAYANYSYVDATYQFSGMLSSPFNPFADANGNIFVHPGDHIPGIPRQQAKFGFDYLLTPKFKFGGDVLIVGSQYYRRRQFEPEPAAAGLLGRQSACLLSGRPITSRSSVSSTMCSTTIMPPTAPSSISAPARNSRLDAASTIRA